ncbi:MAG: hypothetical protein H0T92_08785 [Pyrinomonadaceae bacterium]|nr:hypothetical protein [Pyrinomonadaceae bacterium]
MGKIAEHKAAFVVGDGNLFNTVRIDGGDSRADNRTAELIGYLAVQSSRVLLCES